jgi:hypothetical protein
MYFVLATFVVLCLTLAYVTYNLLIKVEKMEDELTRLNLVYQTNLDSLRDTFIDAEIELKQLDINGTFESDDEVGIMYKSIRTIILDLDRTIKEYEKSQG